MLSQEEKSRRKALKLALRQAERDAIRTNLPSSPAEMRRLFDFIDQQLSRSKCDGTLQITLAFLAEKQLPTAPVTSWLENAGGSCDCEVLANVEEKFLFAFPEYQ